MPCMLTSFPGHLEKDRGKKPKQNPHHHRCSIILKCRDLVPLWITILVFTPNPPSVFVAKKFYFCPQNAVPVVSCDAPGTYACAERGKKRLSSSVPSKQFVGIEAVDLVTPKRCYLLSNSKYDPGRKFCLSVHPHIFTVFVGKIHSSPKDG